MALTYCSAYLQGDQKLAAAVKKAVAGKKPVSDYWKKYKPSIRNKAGAKE